MALKIDIAANTRQAQSSITDLSKDLDKVADSLDDVAKDGADAGAKLERSFKDMVREAKEADKAVEKIGDGGKRGFGKAGDAAEEFKGEALQNVSEVVSSFDGSMESIGEVVQGTLGGVSSNLGLLGAAAVPIAASVGLITEAFVKAGEATDEARDSAYAYGLTVAETGAYADAASRINDLTGSVEGLKEVQDIATVSGWKQQDVLKAMATGDGLPALTKAYNEGANSTTIATNRSLELTGILEGTAQGFELAAHGADLNASALFDLAMQAGTATGEVDDLGNAIVKMPDGKDVVVNAQTRQAFMDIDAVEKQKLSDKEARVRLAVDTSAWDRWNPTIKQGRVAVGRGGAGGLTWD
jgi:hypothetical protein